MEKLDIINILLDCIPVGKQQVKEQIEKNFKNHKDSVDEAFAGLRLEVAEKVLEFLKNTDELTNDKIIEFIDNVIFDKEPKNA